MERFVRLVPPNGAVEILGVKLVGVTAENGRKLLFTLAFVALMVLVSRVLRAVARPALRGRAEERGAFWARQGIRLFTAILMLLGLVSIWFDDPTRLTTALGLVTAGLAFALQKVVTSVAGYLVILRGKTFNVGDRITMGGVRGDVIALGFLQTTIMEMGQPPAVEPNTDPAMWVRSRQYTGRIVTVSNAKIFDEPVYNYTREFPYIWEEMKLPFHFRADLARAERILLDAAGRHAVATGEMGEEALAELERRYAINRASTGPRVFYRLTGDWMELTVRFLTHAHGVREVKDGMSREILRGLNEAGIGLAATAFEIADVPPIRVHLPPDPAR